MKACSLVMPVIFKYWSRSIPCIANCWFISAILFSTSLTTIDLGTSTLESATTFWINFPTKLFWTLASSLAVISAVFLAFKSSTDSNPASFANSSVNSGLAKVLIEFIFTLNVAGFPANASAWYSAGKVTLISPSCPTVYPTNWSSNVSINIFDPNFNWWESAFPPSNGTPSINPSKARSTVFPISALCPSGASSNLDLAFNMFSISLSKRSSVIWKVSFSTSKPLYSPKVISG